MSHPPLLPLHFSFIFKVILFLSSLFLPTTYCASDGESYTNCAPFTCGNFSNISYPFWVNNQPDYCGHPKFKLVCQQQDQVTIDIMSQKFLVIDINQNTQILKIARLDLWSDPCPKEYTNVMMDSDFYNFTSNDDNITLFYDCDPLPYALPVNFNPALTFSCTINGVLVSCLVLNTKLVNIFDPGCKSRIIVPVLTEAYQSSISSIKDVLDKGFEVGWIGVNGDQCDSCIQSGGRCGHNSSTNEFICFCRNQQSYGGICRNSPAWPSLPALAPSPTPSQALSSPANLPKYQEQYPGDTRNNFFLRPRYCGGDDAFKIKCLKNNSPSVQVDLQNFTILDINPTTYTMRMVRTDIINYDDYSLDFTNTSLNSTLFQYASVVHNITIFYNCDPGFSIGRNNFTCRGDTDKHVFYVDKNKNLLQQFPDLVLNCGASVQVPILYGTFLDPNGGVAALESALSYGFEVQYNADYYDCKECSKSGGACGRDDKLKFSCHFKAGTYDVACPNHRSLVSNSLLLFSSHS